MYSLCPGTGAEWIIGWDTVNQISHYHSDVNYSYSFNLKCYMYVCVLNKYMHYPSNSNFMMLNNNNYSITELAYAICLLDVVNHCHSLGRRHV